MERKNLTKEQKALLRNMRDRQRLLLKQRENFTGCYVLAGYGGDTYYSYVGKGNGYKGADLFPVCSYPHVFHTEEEAKKAVSGTYWNGNGDIIDLEAIPARDYFTKLYDDLKSLMETFFDIINKGAQA